MIILGDRNRDTFSGYHPLIVFVFFIGALFYGMIFIHPVFLSCSFLGASFYFISVSGIESIPYIIKRFPLVIAIGVINPIFNYRGETVIFTYFGRNYTLEALCYGLCIGIMFVSVLIWFSGYNLVMTEDKFLYIFGRSFPLLSLTLSMILRLIPIYKKRLNQIIFARECIGKGMDILGKNSDFRDKIRAAENGGMVISALTSWALEGGIITADSMRARGFGTGKRSYFNKYNMTGRDLALLFSMILCFAVTGYCAYHKGAWAEFTPGFNITGLDNKYLRLGFISYFIFLIIPTVINYLEAIKWNIIKSKI